MKRSPTLVQLSREHHTALSLALRIEKATTDSAQAAIAATLPALFRGELEPHFQEEEGTLLPALKLAGETAAVERTLQEHARLRDLAAAIRQGAIPALAEFGLLLRAHVRFEERELFPLAERVLPGLTGDAHPTTI